MLSVFIDNASVWKMHLRSEQNEFTYVLYECGCSKIVKNALKWKAWPKNIAGVCVCSMVFEFNLCHNAQLYHFQTLKCGQSKMHDQKQLVWMRIDQCVFDDNKNAYFWKCTSVDSPRPPGGYFRNFWVGMCRWDPGTLNLPELVQLNFATLY